MTSPWPKFALGEEENGSLWLAHMQSPRFLARVVEVSLPGQTGQSLCFHIRAIDPVARQFRGAAFARLMTDAAKAFLRGIDGRRLRKKESISWVVGHDLAVPQLLVFENSAGTFNLVIRAGRNYRNYSFAKMRGDRVVAFEAIGSMTKRQTERAIRQVRSFYRGVSPAAPAAV